MAGEYSIIEFVVYALIGYAGILILMVSILLNPPTSISLAGIRSIWLMPSVLALSMLMFMGGVVTTETTTTETTITKSNNDIETYENSIQTSQIQLINPIWSSFHMGLFLIEIIYIIVQVVNILRAKDE